MKERLTSFLLIWSAASLISACTEQMPQRQVSMGPPDQQREKMPGSRLDEYNLPLCGNCRIVRTNGSEVTIVRSEGKVQPLIVHGNVKKVAIKPPYVAGFTTVLAGDPDVNAQAQAGFFVLNTDTGEVKQGLKEQPWRSELEHINWQNPELTPPK